MGETEKIKSSYWKYEKIAYILGKWAWVFAIISAIINMLLGIYGIVLAIQFHQYMVSTYGSYYTNPLYISPYDVWIIVISIILIIFAFLIIRPRFSNNCADKDWDFLLNDVLNIGSVRFPWMFIWAIIAEILGHWWGGLLIIVPALLLIFAGPKEYKWKK